jgi:heme-degrading monooxygenase HmoA
MAGGEGNMITEMLITRRTYTRNSTIGDLYIDGQYFCHTLEDTILDVKIAGVTAIPYGRYEVIINFSNRFQRPMPLLLNVPGFLGIRIHSGNTDEDTEGCILVGFTEADDFIGNSKSAFSQLFSKIQKSLKQGKVWMTVSGKIIGA